MAEVELDNLSPTRKAETLGDAQTELKANIEGGWTADEGRASVQRQLHTDQLAAESPLRADGETDVEFKEGWMEQGGRAGINSREIGPGESGADEETDIPFEEGWAAEGGPAGEKRKENRDVEDEYDASTTTFGFFSSHSFINEGSEDGRKRSTQDEQRTQFDNSEKPHINLCQVRNIMY